MCCFSRKVDVVSSTKIFARHLGNKRQALIYQLSVAADEALAMILPIPSKKADEDDVIFYNFASYKSFFSDLEKEFPLMERVMKSAPSKGVKKAAAKTPRATLVVHSVGSFVASFVPTLDDFDRLDERFKLPGAVWDALPQYKDYGFAVFQLKPSQKKASTMQPMAFSFTSRDASRLFFPTVHVHDGSVSEMAYFDHILYYQGNSEDYKRERGSKKFTFAKKPMIQGVTRVDASVGVFWGREAFTKTKLSSKIDGKKAKGLVAKSLPAHRVVLKGSRPNVDHWASFEPLKKPAAKPSVKKAAAMPQRRSKRRLA